MVSTMNFEEYIGVGKEFCLMSRFVSLSPMCPRHYLTANSCIHEGYLDYDWPRDWDYGWNRVGSGVGADTCGPGGAGAEQFWNCAEVKIKRNKSKEDKKKKQSEKTSGSSADKFARGNKKKDKPDKKRKKPDKRKKPGKEDRQKDKKKRPGKRKNSPKKKRDEDKHNMRKPMYPTEHGMKRGIAR